MKNLTDELKEEHSLLVNTLQDVKKFGISTLKGREYLAKAKNLLLGHLKKEDEKLYPMLREQAKENDSLNDLLSIFARDMESVSILALNFFKKYEHAEASMEFARDFGILYAALGNRIRKEESTLYEEYNNLMLIKSE